MMTLDNGLLIAILAVLILQNLPQFLTWLAARKRRLVRDGKRTLGWISERIARRTSK